MSQAQLQVALYDRLTTDIPLMSQVDAIQDYYGQESQKYTAYIVIGDDTSNSYGSKTFDGLETSITLHIWAVKKGRLYLKQIMDTLFAVLQNKPLAVSDANMLQIQHSFSDSFLEPDGVSFHGVMRFRTLMIED